MPKPEVSSVETTIKRAKASKVYRTLPSSQARARWLHVEHGISQRRAAKEEGISRAAVQRAINADAANREEGKQGRPRLLKVDLEEQLKDKIVRRSAGLNSMNLEEIREEVRPL